MRLSIASLALLSAFAIPAAAHASDVFTITSGPVTMTFTLPTSPTPDVAEADVLFKLENVGILVNGVSLTDDIGFYTADQGGGFYDTDGIFGAPYGDQYFTGDVTAPTFVEGSYDFSADEGGPTTGTLTISATPEPSSLMLLGTGVLGVAGVLRRRLA